MRISRIIQELQQYNVQIKSVNLFKEESQQINDLNLMENKIGTDITRTLTTK